MTQAHDDERPPLLREADHRVRNDLQLIGSLVGLHGRRADGDAARAGFKALAARIAAVGLAHRHVLRRDGLEWTDAAGLVRDLAQDLAGREGVAVELSLEPVVLPARQGAPLALLAGEMIGNALAHAFPDGRTGRVAVTLARAPGACVLCVRDDGVGIGAAPKGFGLTIVQLMARQLRGTLTTHDAQPGVLHSVSIPMETHASPT